METGENGIGGGSGDQGGAVVVHGGIQAKILRNRQFVGPATTAPSIRANEDKPNGYILGPLSMSERDSVIV